MLLSGDSERSIESRRMRVRVSTPSTTIPLPKPQPVNTFPYVVVVPATQSSTRVAPQQTGQIETLVIDRQPLFLAALGSLLAAPEVGSHVLSAARSDVGLDIIRTTKVDLVCCELHAEPISGVELVQVLADEKPDLPVILLGEVVDDGQLASAMAANVAGLFTKSSDPEEFLAGVRAVMSGHRAIGSGVIGHLTAHLTSGRGQESRRVGHQLSPTELEILAMIGRAESIRSIAASRGISHKTVRNHLAKIYRKLELHGRTEAMLWAARMGLTGS
jgi:DNA-binding NarL/FixJ family response regulator